MLPFLPSTNCDNGYDITANFLRNLDEADLERLDPEAYARTVDALGPEEDMRVFGRGLRRRLAPMLDGAPDRIRMAWSLLLPCPGAPLICYGDEIGMGEDLSQKGRNAVRSPMQWTKGRLPRPCGYPRKRGGAALPRLRPRPDDPAQPLGQARQAGSRSRRLVPGARPPPC